MEKANNFRGLTDKEVVKSREEYGENVLTPPKKTSLWRLYLDKYNDPIIRYFSWLPQYRLDWLP